MWVAIGGAATAGPLEDAVAAYQRGDYATALRLWHPLAEQGDADAQFHLGVMYENGQGLPRNYLDAIKWYRKAAEQNDAVAQFNLGVMYAKGVSPNYAEAALWYRLAAGHGLAGAVEDVHWADPATLDVLRGITERGAPPPGPSFDRRGCALASRYNFISAARPFGSLDDLLRRHFGCDAVAGVDGCVPLICPQSRKLRGC